MSKFKIRPSSLAPIRDLDATDVAYIPIITKVGGYSITPTTLQSVTAFPDSVGATPLRSVERYDYRGNTVQRFVINTEFIDVNAPTSVVAIGETTPKATTVGSGAYTLAAANSVRLHILEKNLLTDAIGYLNTSTDKTVLVDFFERNNGGPINRDAMWHPITHTVVLYKSTFTVQVIDPSNFLYSSHLANTAFNTELLAARLSQIQTLHKKIEIYKPSGATGYGAGLYRNCTDIAIKLALGFKDTPITNLDVIGSHPVVLHISNQRTIDKEIIDPSIAARIKQDSSVLAQEAFAQSQSDILLKIKMLGLTSTAFVAPVAGAVAPTIPAASAVALQQEYTTILSPAALTPTTTLDTLHALDRLNLDYNTKLSAMLSSKYQTVHHHIDAYDHEC